MLIGFVADEPVVRAGRYRGPGFVAVGLDVTKAEGRFEDMLAALLAHRSNEYELAVHSTTHAVGVEEGVRVRRMDIDSSAKTFESLYCVFCVGNTDYAISTQMYDVSASAWAVPRITKFIDGIAPTQAA